MTAASPAPRSLLRFITCGSVDDGKSTLMGRLLWDCGTVPDDERAGLEEQARRSGGEPDVSRLFDGLAAEREQGVTIDVAYRYFSTRTRSFIIADAPGHEQYTRNMATGASTSDLAVVLVDARKGLLPQTRRHSLILSLLGVREVVLAVNKMDLVAWSEDVFAGILSEYAAVAERLGLGPVSAVPLSALTGDNVVRRSERTPWHAGPSLLELLESTAASEPPASGPFRFPVQWVSRAADFRGYAGMVLGGQETRIARVVTADGDAAAAEAGQSVTLTLADDVDVSRGDLLASADAPPAATDQLQADIIWMSEHPLLPGRLYQLQLGAASAGASVTQLRHRVDPITLEALAARTLELNEIGVCNLALDRRIAFDPYGENRDTGGFILIDRVSNETVGAGMVRFALGRAENVSWTQMDVDRAARGALKGQRGGVVWLTGLSGAGKSTIANLLERRLHEEGRHTYVLDGDNLRHGLNQDLGFTEADRVENVRRVAEVARLMADAGLIVLVSLISPFRAERRMARERIGPEDFIEVFVDVPLEVAEERDPKGLYARARQGEIRNFTGVDSPYEPPEREDLRIDTSAASPEQGASAVYEAVRGRGFF